MNTPTSLSDLIPTPPNEGPPLPEFLKIYWPWYKPSTAATTFTITASVSGSGGTVSPASVTVIAGNDDSITILPASGYQVDSITDNGVAVTVANPYVINNVTVDHAVVVTFAASTPGATGPAAPPTGTFTVTATVSGGNGTVSPASQVENSGGSASITILPASGYEINTITDNGTAVTNPANPYVINNVTQNHAVVVTFAKSAAALSGLVITSAGTQVAVGQGLQCGATVKQADGTPLDVTNTYATVWKSSNPAVATISSLGSVSGVTVGTTVISATYNDGVNNLTSNQITITVVAAPAALGTLVITVSPSGATVQINGQTITPGTYGNQTPGTYNWTASATGYATQYGTVTITSGMTTTLNITLAASTAPTPPPVAAPGTVTMTIAGTVPWDYWTFVMVDAKGLTATGGAQITTPSYKMTLPSGWTFPATFMVTLFSGGTQMVYWGSLAWLETSNNGYYYTTALITAADSFTLEADTGVLTDNTTGAVTNPYSSVWATAYQSYLKDGASPYQAAVDVNNGLALLLEGWS